MRIVAFVGLFLIATVLAPAQDEGVSYSRGSIPEELLRPKRGEAPFYPVDIVIGALGQGEASDEAYSFARSIAIGFFSGGMGHPSLETVNAVSREGYLSALDTIQPVNYRIGGGKEEPDGAISFLVRFMGRELCITGELFVRYVTKQTEKIISGGAGEEVKEDKEIANGEEGEEIKESEVNEESEVVEVIEEPKVEIITTGEWMFDDLILEEAKSREEEKNNALQRFDFSPYERFF